MTTDKAALNYSELDTFPPDGSQMTFSKVEMCSIDLGQAGANILYLVGINCGTVVETRFPYARFLPKVSLSLEVATHLHPPGLQHTCLHQY